MQLASRFASRSPSLRSDSPLSDDQILTLPLESVSHSRLMHWRAGVGWRASFLRTASG